MIDVGQLHNSFSRLKLRVENIECYLRKQQPLEDKLAEKTTQINAMNNIINRLHSEITELTDKLCEREQCIEGLRQELHDMRKSLNGTIQRQDDLIREFINGRCKP